MSENSGSFSLTAIGLGMIISLIIAVVVIVFFIPTIPTNNPAPKIKYARSTKFDTSDQEKKDSK